MKAFDMKELYLIITGKVQGIFFRATIKDIANKLNLFGYAKNLRDGSVEVLVQGEKGALVEFVEMIKKSPGRSEVEQVKENLREIQKNFTNFKIL
jgi:acylphosphatase